MGSARGRLRTAGRRRDQLPLAVDPDGGGGLPWTPRTQRGRGPGAARDRVGGQAVRDGGRRDPHRAGRSRRIGRSPTERGDAGRGGVAGGLDVRVRGRPLDREDVPGTVRGPRPHPDRQRLLLRGAGSALHVPQHAELRGAGVYRLARSRPGPPRLPRAYGRADGRRSGHERPLGAARGARTPPAGPRALLPRHGWGRDQRDARLPLLLRSQPQLPRRQAPRLRQRVARRPRDRRVLQAGTGARRVHRQARAGDRRTIPNWPSSSGSPSRRRRAGSGSRTRSRRTSAVEDATTPRGGGRTDGRHRSHVSGMLRSAPADTFGPRHRPRRPAAAGRAPGDSGSLRGAAALLR